MGTTCAARDEFKIFTNINSTIVDPKSFDEKSFVDFKGPVCIIPPNSFALASTVEYFRIPRTVLVATVGKSTYARAFAAIRGWRWSTAPLRRSRRWPRRHAIGESSSGAIASGRTGA